MEANYIQEGVTSILGITIIFNIVHCSCFKLTGGGGRRGAVCGMDLKMELEFLSTCSIFIAMQHVSCRKK